MHEGKKLHKENVARITILHGESFLHDSKKKQKKKLKDILVSKQKNKKVTDQG